jgi:YidC/Oxa1 family membrane protein insertase
MDKKTILAVGLSIAVLLVFQIFFAPKQAATPKTDNTKQTTKTTQKESVKKSENTQTSEKTNQKTTQSSLFRAKEVTIQNKNIKLIINEITGNLIEADVLSFNGKTLKNINFKTDSNEYFTLTTGVENKFKVKDIQNNGKKITLVAESDNYIVTKTYELKDEGYLVDFTTEFYNKSDGTLTIPLVAQIGPGLGDIEANDRYIFTGPIMYDGKKIYDEKQALKKTVTEEKPLWIGYTSKYYLFAVAGKHFEKGIFKPVGNKTAVIQGQEIVALQPNTKEKRTFHIFVGPKQYDLLKSVGYGFEKSIAFGIFAFLAIPMLKTLIFLHSFVGNYGVAIILLTIIIKIITYPLTLKSMVSMKKMQQYQPKIQAIKEKYKGDQQKINAATMELYKKEGINPVGGCLPMFLQIPIFFALYKALMVAIELNGAPFFGWIVDLSAKDPYYITPILMGITMFLQQKLSPAAGDKMQQRLFLAMPIIFTFLFLSFPAGLVVYWLTNNILTIIQQMFINKKFA